MRRHSLIGPVVLIAIGVLFLLNNVMPELPVWQLVADYWPFALILFGAIRLVEILVLRAQGRPLPAHGISGGEWGLVIFLCLVGSALFVGHRFGERIRSGVFTSRGLEILGEAYDFPISGEKPAGSAKRVVIENLRGDARIIGSDAPVIKVSGRHSVRAFDSRDADKVKEQCPLEIVPQGDIMLIRTNQDRASSTSKMSSYLEITVPRGMQIEGRGRYGDFDISDVTGGVTIDSDNAGVRISNVGGNVRVDTRRSDIVRAANVKGGVEFRGRGQDVEVENVVGPVVVAGDYSGEKLFRNLAGQVRYESGQTEFRAEKIAGEVRMDRGSIEGANLSGPAIFKSKSRDVRFSDFSGSVEVTVNRGDIELRPGRQLTGPVTAKTEGGNIELAVPESAAFELRANADKGEIQNDFGSPLKLEQEGRGAKLTGTVGRGPQITLDSRRGSINVRKTSASPMPPAPPAPSAAPKAPAAPDAPKGLPVQQQ